MFFLRTTAVTLSQFSGAVLANYSMRSETAPGERFTLLDNDGADAVAGVFSGLPEGSMLDTGAYGFQISCVGGKGNDVTLLVIPRPVPALPRSGLVVLGVLLAFAGAYGIARRAEAKA